MTKKSAKPGKNREFLVIMYLFFILFLMMVAYFVYFMAIKSENFINSPYNSLQDLFSERVVRGDILSADGEVLATTKVSSDGTQTRSYPYGRVFAHVVGYATNGKAGLENQVNFSLLRSHEFFLKQVAADLSGELTQGDNVVTTLDAAIQKRAYDELGSYDGAVIAMQPSTGKIIAMVSKPDYDPNTVQANWATLTSEDSTVLFNRATQGSYAPGSVFKIVTALEYYRENSDSYKDYTYDCDSSITVEGATIHCAGNQSHGAEDLKSSFAHSCNSSFANLSLTLDRSRFASTCSDLLFNTDLPIAFESSKSCFSLKKSDSTSMVMETGIGQGKTLVSPLHMLLIASAIDNDGVLMAPYLVDHTENPDGILVSETKQREYGTLMTEDEAGVLQQYMRAVVTDGTGSKLSGQSYEASGKTGTAQVSDTSDQTNAWFVGYAKKDGYEDLAVAVVVEDSGAGSTYAVPIAKKIFDLYFNR
jgi:peptidoglycan glycosyltransferase